MISDCRDLTLSAVLADPMIGAMMAADGVDRRAFETFMREKAEVLHASRRVLPLPTRPTPTRDRSWRPRMCFA